MDPGTRICWRPRPGSGPHGPVPVGPKSGPDRVRGGPYYGTLATWIGLDNGHRVALVFHEITRSAYLAFADELEPFDDGRDAPGSRVMPWEET